MVARTYTEAEKMRMVPGISYMDGPAGSRAHVDHAGLDVWEIIQTYLQAGRDAAVITAVWEHMTPADVRAALDFYALFPDEIDARLEDEEKITPETLPGFLRGEWSFDR